VITKYLSGLIGSFYMIRHKNWVWLCVSKAVAQVTALTVEVPGGYLVTENDNLGHLVVTSGLKFWKSTLICLLPVKASGDRR